MGKLQIHRRKTSHNTPFQPASRPFAPASAVRRTSKAPAVASEVAPQHATRGLDNAPGHRADDRLRAQPATQVQTKRGSVEMSPNNAVQRVASQIAIGSEDGMIDRISIVGRPPRAHAGTMGDHSTAFTSLATSLNIRLSEKSIEEVYFLIINLYSDMKKLPGMSLVGNMPPLHKQQFKEALGNLEDLLDYMYSRYSDRRQLGVEKMPYTGHDVTLVQDLIDAFLEARELVPLSTINTKALNASLAGKGKGETAKKLALAEKGQSVPESELAGNILGLFDARSAAVVASVSDQELMNKVAPGMSVEIKPDDRKEMMIKQHLQSIASLYPIAWKKFSEDGIKEIQGSLLRMVNEKMEENRQAQEEGKKIKGKRGSNGYDPYRKYVATSLQVSDDNLIKEIRTEGRTPSPFSGTMGAHTTAWTLLVERIRVELKGCTILEAASILRDISSDAEKHLGESAEIFQADTKQMHLLINALKELWTINEKLETIESIAQGEKIEKGFSPFQQVLILQEAVDQILNLQNLTPGASLYVGNTNGAREGAYRGILVKFRDNKEGSKEVVRKAVLGLLDLRSLDEHISTLRKTIKSEQNDKSRQGYEHTLYHEFLMQNERPQGDSEKSIKFLVGHHIDLIEIAFPGALAYAGIEDDEDKFLALALESLLYSNDEEFEPDDEE